VPPSFSFPAGTDLRLPPDRYDRHIETLIAPFVARLHPALRIEGERSLLRIARLWRPALTLAAA